MAVLTSVMRLQHAPIQVKVPHLSSAGQLGIHSCPFLPLAIVLGSRDNSYVAPI